MGPTERKQGQCTQLPIISKVKKYHNKNTKKILRKKLKKQEIVCRVYTSQYKVACHDADKEGSSKIVTERKQFPSNIVVVVQPLQFPMRRQVIRRNNNIDVM